MHATYGIEDELFFLNDFHFGRITILTMLIFQTVSAEERPLTIRKSWRALRSSL